MEKFSFFKKKEAVETAPEKPELFPQAIALLEHYEKAEGVTAESVETMREVLRTITEHSLENSRLYHSEKTGAEFPYTSVSVREIAESILRKRGEAVPEIQEDESAEKKRDFLIVSFPPVVDAGGQFEWVEFPIHSITMMLPQAFEALRSGRAPKEYKTYTLGYPTNEFGLVSEAFAHELSQDAVKAIANIHSEFITEETKKEHLSKNDAVSLTGISLGSSIAAEIGSELLENGCATQEKEEEKPRLSVAMYAPVGDKALSDGVMRAPQVAAGFAGDTAYQWLTNPGVKTIERERSGFMKGARAELADRMEPRLDDGQAKLKQGGIFSLAKAVAKGRTLPEKVKVTEILGVSDPLVYSRARSKEFTEHTDAHTLPPQEEKDGARGPTLGSSLLSRPEENQRLFGANMPHLVPFYRDSEWQRFNAAATEIQKVEK